MLSRLLVPRWVRWCADVLPLPGNVSAGATVGHRGPSPRATMGHRGHTRGRDDPPRPMPKGHDGPPKPIAEILRAGGGGDLTGHRRRGPHGSSAAKILRVTGGGDLTVTGGGGLMGHRGRTGRRACRRGRSLASLSFPRQLTVDGRMMCLPMAVRGGTLAVRAQLLRDSPPVAVLGRRKPIS